MSGNGRFWTGLAFGALTGAAIGAAAFSGSRCCYGNYGYNSFGYLNYVRSFGFLNSCYTGYTGCGIGYGRTGWGYNSVVYGPDAFTAMYAPNHVLANANLGYYI